MFYPLQRHLTPGNIDAIGRLHDLTWRPRDSIVENFLGVSAVDGGNSHNGFLAPRMLCFLQHRP